MTPAPNSGIAPPDDPRLRGVDQASGLIGVAVRGLDAIVEGVRVPLRVHLPSSQPLAGWRAPWWQRILFPAAGVAMVTAAFWPYAGEAYGPLWLLAALGVGFVWYALRPRLVLYPDAVYVRGHILSRVIPIDQVSAVQGGHGGLTIWWGDGSMSEASRLFCRSHTGSSSVLRAA